MTVRAQPSAPSTLATLIGQVVDAFSAMGDATPIMIGEQYMETGVGTYPRVVFVPEDGNGKIAPAVSMGDAASQVHACTFYVRAAESGEDVERLAAAYALSDLVIGCLAVAGSGRLTWGSVKNDSPTKADAFGAGLKVSFTFTRDILHSPARWALPPASDDTGDVLAVPPPGIPASGVTVDPTTVPINS